MAGKGSEASGIKAYWEIGLLALSIWPLHQYVCTTPAMDAYRDPFVGLDITYDTLMCWDPAKSGLLSGTRNKILVWAHRQIIQLSEEIIYLLSRYFDFTYWDLLQWGIFNWKGPFCCSSLIACLETVSV